MLWDLCFWEPNLSPHKLPLVHALLGRADVRSVHYVAQTGLSAERQREGWNTGPLDGIELTVCPSDAEIARILDSQAQGTVNIVSGLRRVPVIVGALRGARRRGARYGIMSEPRASEGAAGLLRRAQSAAAEGGLRRSADFVLAIGRNGPPWFRSAGYPAARIFPFAYFPHDSGPIARRGGDTVPAIGYLGRLVPEKGIRQFLKGFAAIEGDCIARVAGAGACEAEVRRFLAPPGKALEFGGALPMDRVPAFMAAIDVLVVPSLTTADGWAVVVSEALLAGVPVVATRKVGASICLDAPGNGEAIAAGSPSAIARAVERILSGGPATAEDRERRSAWAGARLGAEPGAGHLIAILEAVYRGGAAPAPFYR